MAGLARGERLQIMLTDEELVALDDWRFDKRMPSRAAAVRELLKRGLAENRTAMQAIGYRQVVEHLRGERKLPETIELVKIRTRQFAKRQMTWFRRQTQLNWLAVQPRETAESVAARIMEALAAADGP